MVGCADEAFAFHPLDPFRRRVVAHAHLALEPRSARLLVLEYDLAGLAIFALFGIVARRQLVVEAEAAAFLRLFRDGIDIVGRALAAPVIGHRLDLLVGHEGPMHTHHRTGIGLVEHIALAQQLFRSLLAEDGARIDPAGDLEADPGR